MAPLILVCCPNQLAMPCIRGIGGLPPGALIGGEPLIGGGPLIGEGPLIGGGPLTAILWLGGVSLTCGLAMRGVGALLRSPGGIRWGFDLA